MTNVPRLIRTPTGRTTGLPGRPRRSLRRIALTVVLVAITAAVLGGTRTGLAESPGASPAAPPTITVSASWDGGPPASWSAYTAVVKNIGKAAFRGELVVGPEESAKAAGPVAPGPHHGMGSAEPARPAAPGPHGGMGPPGPSGPVPLIGAAHHRSPLVLDPGEERTVRALLVVSPVSYRAEVHDQGGHLVAGSAALPLAASTADQIGLLSDAPTGRAFFLFGTRSAVALSSRFHSAGDFPSEVSSLRGLGAVVIDDFDSAALSRDQLDALRGFLQMGGSLMLAGGAAWQRTVRPLPEDLSPLRPTATASASLAPMADLALVPGDAAVTAAVGELVGGRSVLEGPQQIPLIVEKDYGAGRIVQLAFDPLADLAAPPSQAMAGLARDHALARAGLGTTVRSDQATAMAAMRGDDFLAILDGPKRPLTALTPFSVILGLYALLLGPAAYFGLRRRGRASRLWSLAPILAVSLAAAVLVVSQPLQPGTVDHQVQVQRQVQGGTLLVDSWHRLRPAGSGDAKIAVDSGALAWVEPRPADQPGGLPPLVSALVADQPVGGDDGTSTVRGGESTVVQFGRWPVWAERTVRTSTAARQATVLDADLRIVDGLVVGRVTNRGDAPVRDLRLQAPDGRGSDLATALGPGQSTDVRVKLAVRAPPAADTPASLLDLVGGQLTAKGGEVDILGLVAAREVLRVDGANPKTRASAVLVDTVRLQSADTLTAGLGTPRLVCACGTSGPLVYEMQLPPGLASPLIVVAPPVSGTPPPNAVEVYHWPSHSWRSLPGAVGLPGSTTLEAGDLDSGLVRLRVRAPNAVLTLRSGSPGN